jgi:thioester reductase-like protein
MSDKKTVLVTGSTGALGAYLLSNLLQEHNVHIILLIRASSHEAARHRIADQVRTNPNVEVYRADLTHDSLGLDSHEYTDLASRVTHILHSAASTRFNLPLHDARLQNVKTTQNMLQFAHDCKHLTRFVHMSSALTAGKRTGVIYEHEFEHAAGFINTYEQTKYESEVLVRKHLKELPIVILRPPLIITKPHEKYDGPVNLLSHLVRLIKKKYIPFVPGLPTNTFDMVDGAETAEIVIKLLLKDVLKYDTYHISNGDKALTTGKVAEILENFLGRPLGIEFCGSMDEFNRRVWWRSWYRPKLAYVYKKISYYIPEAAYSKIYDNSRLQEELSISTLQVKPQEVFSTMLEW